jgi:hypothetical protein
MRQIVRKCKKFLLVNCREWEQALLVPALIWCRCGRCCCRCVAAEAGCKVKVLPVVGRVQLHASLRYPVQLLALLVVAVHPVIVVDNVNDFSPRVPVWDVFSAPLVQVLFVPLCQRGQSPIGTGARTFGQRRFCLFPGSLSMWNACLFLCSSCRASSFSFASCLTCLPAWPRIFCMALSFCLPCLLSSPLRPPGIMCV